MKLNPEGVKKATAAMEACFDDGGDDPEAAFVALTAYFDHLKSEGLMADAQLEFGGARFNTTIKNAVVIKMEVAQ